MATKISTEILIMILNNVQSLQDLYSSLLVNRIWCKVTIPILWELPFDQDHYNVDRGNKELRIRTYISCMNAQARTLLTQNGFDLSSSPPQATFDYPSFTHKLNIDNLVCHSNLYSQQIINQDQDDNNNNNESRELLFRELLKLIINRCSFLDCFELGSSYRKYSGSFIKSDLICLILKLPGAPKVFKKLETLVLMMNAPFGDLCELLALICDSILNMSLRFHANDDKVPVPFLAKLISVQKRLEKLSIDADVYQDCNPLLWAIVNQKETLKSLRLLSVNLRHFEGKSSPIGQFISLQELYIFNCFGLHKSNILFLASSFTQLSSFRFSHIYSEYPQEFIIKIFETANTKLRKIYLNPNTTDTFSAILNYCTKITELTLLNLSPEQVIAIFNNNFNELKRFSFSYRKGLDANKLLCQMAENVPRSLETIEINMLYGDSPWKFSANSLRKFFEGWCCKGGGGNKKIIVEREELFTLSDEHFKVFEEYGVQFDIKKTK